CRGEGIAARRIAMRNLGAVVQADVIEGSPAWAGRRLSRQLRRTEAASAQCAPHRPLDLHREKAPIEVGVVRDEDAPVQYAEQLIANLGEGWGISYHVPRDIR